jgi:AcrR family transcriptional regulator
MTDKPPQPSPPANAAGREIVPRRRRRDRELRENEILEAAFEEFAARGYAAARIEDVAHRAGVAKGLPSFYFDSKLGLFKAVLRRLVLPDWDALEAQFRGSERSSPELLRELIAMIYDKMVGNPRAHQLVRLLVAEGPRLPELTEFYHAELVERAIRLLRTLLARGVERGDIRPGPVTDYPQTVMAPALMAVLWSLLFAERHPLDHPRFFAAHLDLVLYGLAPR